MIILLDFLSVCVVSTSVTRGDDVGASRGGKKGSHAPVMKVERPARCEGDAIASIAGANGQGSATCSFGPVEARIRNDATTASNARHRIIALRRSHLHAEPRTRKPDALHEIQRLSNGLSV